MSKYYKSEDHRLLWSPFYLESSAKVEELGGKILVPKMAVPKMGHFELCMDTEGNVFGIREDDPQAK